MQLIVRNHNQFSPASCVKVLEDGKKINRILYGLCSLRAFNRCKLVKQQQYANKNRQMVINKVSVKEVKPTGGHT